MAALKEEKKFVKDLVGDNFLKFKITLEAREKGKALALEKQKIEKILILIARKEATSLTKLKLKIYQSLCINTQMEAGAQNYEISDAQQISILRRNGTLG